MSFGEIILIIFIATLLFGPDKIPEIARGLGQGVRAMKEATDHIKKEVMSKMEEENPLQEIEQEIEQEIAETKKNIDASLEESKENIDLNRDEWEGPIKRS